MVITKSDIMQNRDDNGTLILGLQKGSLNDTEREGFTSELLYGAGFVYSGFEPNGGRAGRVIEFDNFDKIRGKYHSIY